MYRVVYGFYKIKADAKKSLQIIQKKFPKAVIEEDSDGTFTVTYGRETDYKKAVALLHKTFQMGLWAGIETIGCK